MMIIGVDYHPSFQTIAFLMEETGECGEQELNHRRWRSRTFLPGAKAERSQRAGGIGGHRIFTLV
jgi:hypothetical protein